MKRAADTAIRAGGAIERFIERTRAPRLEELAGEVRGLRGELGQFDKRLTDGIASLRSEMTALRGEMIARIDGMGAATNARIESVRAELNARIDTLGAAVNARIDSVDSRLDSVNTRIDALGGQVNTRIDALTQRVDDALNIRERLVALEARFARSS